jgi:RNA polymerase sigma factor (sigma-70 family)
MIGMETRTIHPAYGCRRKEFLDAMRFDPGPAALRDLETLFDAGPLGLLTDGQLLERYATGAPGHDSDAAFALLVERHGPMVLRVSRSAGLDAHAVDDAFQATFLALAMQSRRLWVRGSLAPWLHQVALRTARAARKGAKRRERHESSAARRQAIDDGPTPPEVVETSEREQLLHAEIDRLPSRHRAPVVLCDLQQRPLDEAARLLGCPVGTVKSRLSRGRSRLRSRLAARGLAPVVGLIVGGPEAMAATFRPHLGLKRSALALARAAFGSGRTALVPEALSTLAREVRRIMIVDQVRHMAVPALALAVALGGTGYHLARGGGPQEPGSVERPISAKGDVSPPASVSSTDPSKSGTAILAAGRLSTRGMQVVPGALHEPATVIHALPAGRRVQKGEVLLEFDSAELRDQLTNQEITTRRAEADLADERKALARAERSVAEAADPEREAILKEGADLAREDAAQARAELDQANHPGDRLSDLALKRLGLAARRAELAAREARHDLEAFRSFTHPRQVEEAEIEQDRARGRVYAREATWKLEQQKEARLRRDVDACKILAPFDGFVIAPTAPNPIVIEGDRVDPGQALFAVTEGFEVLTSGIPEADARRIRPGQAVEVPGSESKITGVVESIERMDLPEAPILDPIPPYFVARIKLILDTSITSLPRGWDVGGVTLRILVDQPEASRPDETGHP